MTLLLLFTAVLLKGGHEPYVGAGPVTCGAISLCWEITSSITSESSSRKLYLNSNNILKAGRVRQSGSWSLEPRAEHTLHYLHVNESFAWRIYTMYPPYVEVMSFSGSGAEMVPIRTDNLKMEHSEPRFQLRRSNRLGCKGKMLYSSERNGVALAVVLADRFPLTINTVSTSLSLSWDFRGCFLKDPLCTLLLFDVDGINLHQEIVHDQNREITGLTPCEHYTVCLSIAGHHDVCAATITDPMPPSNLTAVTSSSNSVTVYWDKPALGSFDWFRLNVYLLGQKGESANPLLQSYSLIQSGTTFVIDGLSACQKVNISFATVCEAAEVKESAGIFVVTDTAPVKFVKVTQTAGSTDGYSVSWSVAGDPSEILFYIYKNGTLQLTQKRTEYVATGLRPCTQESLTLEAVCRAGAVADSRTITVATAPEMITNLAYKQTADGGFFSWHSPPLFHGIRISVENVLMAFTRKNYYQVCGLASCTRYQYMFEAVCGRWNSKAVTRAEFTGCPIEAPPSVHKRITVLPEKVHVRIYFPWKFADFMNDPTSRAYLKLASIASSKIVQLLLHPGKFSSVEVELLYMTKSNNTVEMNVAVDVPISSSSASLVHLLSYLNDSNVSARGSALFWNDEDECANITKNDCPEKSDCINTFDSYTCICHQGYFDISDAGKDRGRVCRDHGVFASCKMDFMKINVSKEFLADRVKAPLHLVLNDGSCEVKEEPRYYRFTITETKAYCGGQLLMNETHKIFKHVIINKYHSDSSIIREDPLILVVKCAYLRHSFAKMPLEVPPLVRTFKTIVQYSREKLHLTMSLYKDDTFSPDAAYGASPTIQLNDDLYLEVKSSVTDGTFGAAFVLEVASCWATTTPDSQGKKKFHFLQDSCPIDETFRWHSANGASSSSRFSLKMFHFTETAISPIYLHCQAKICSTGTADDCLTECPGAELPKRLERNVLATDSKPVTGIVSVGPINLWSTTKSVVMDSGNAATNWQHLKVLLWVIGGIIGTTLLIVFAVVVMKKIMIHNTQSKMARHLIQGKAVSSAL